MKKIALILAVALLCMAFAACNTTNGDNTYEINNTSPTEVVTEKETEYHEDGTKTVREYDENEELISETKYDAEGKKI